MQVFILTYLSPVFTQLVFLSLSASLIGLSILMLRRLADGKISPQWKYTLWLLVLVALVVPYRIPSAVSILPNAPAQSLHSNWQSVSEQVADYAELGDTIEYSAKTHSELTQTAQQLKVQAQLFECVLPAIWLVGVLAMTAYLGVGKILLSHHLSKNGQRAPRNLPMLVECKKTLSITRDIPVWVQDSVQTPALTGLFHPKILLPNYVDDLSEDSLRCVLLHELSHWKRGDLWYNGLLLALQTIYWFNPVVWFLFRYIRQDMELCNDAAVLSALSGATKIEQVYATSLVEVLSHYNHIPFAPRLLCMVDDKDNMKRRIQMIQLNETFQKHRIIISISCLAVICILGGLFLTGPTVHADEPPTPTDIETSAVSVATQAPTETDGIAPTEAVIVDTISPVWPLPTAYNEISNSFGHRVHPITGNETFHKGLDIPAPEGTEILAVLAGEVIACDYASYLGNYCVIAHEDGFISLYAHMNSSNVSIGDTVQQGDIVGTVGTTGASTGPHLHYELQENDIPVDPLNYHDIDVTIR